MWFEKVTTGLWKEKVGAHIMITTVTKSWWGIYHVEDYYIKKENEWIEIPGKVKVEDETKIRLLDHLERTMPLTYTIK